MATRCPKVPKDRQWTDPPPCHVEKTLNDGKLHRCRLNASHHGNTFVAAPKSGSNDKSFADPRGPQP